MDQLDLAYCLETSAIVPERSKEKVFMHLVEEVGEVAEALNRPERKKEPLVGELADVINCALDIYYLEYGSDLIYLQDALNLKCAKWRRNAGVQ